MRFRPEAAGGRAAAEVTLEPRSAYMLTGDARTKWQHQIPPVKELRYSLTFRSLRRPEQWLGEAQAP
jgi:alkylated DNA repair dioxygenase AlkB